jgi:UDP-4-amino-4,6-dideoxy-N-acetyl-beta-L-altrosamine N-acetyltransferase
MVKAHHEWLNCSCQKNRMFNEYKIRKMESDDLVMVRAWRNHYDVRRFMFTQHEISLEEHMQWFNLVTKDDKKQLLIVEEGDCPIGFVQFNNVEPGGISEWGFYVRPESPRGTGKKLGTAALNQAFGSFNLHKVCGQAIKSNQSSINFHESLGFKREGELQDQKRIKNQYHSLICFGLLAVDWRNKTIGISN